MKEHKIRASNTDTCEGIEYPINASLQGIIFDRFRPLMATMRYKQLIKKVTYKVTIEYYDEEKGAA